MGRTRVAGLCVDQDIDAGAAIPRVAEAFARRFTRGWSRTERRPS